MILVLIALTSVEIRADGEMTCVAVPGVAPSDVFKQHSKVGDDSSERRAQSDSSFSHSRATVRFPRISSPLRFICFG